MELQFNITRRYEKEFEKLSNQDQKRVASSIDKHAASFDINRGGGSGHVYQLHKINMPDGLDSSLYVLRATLEIRVVLTIEEDPLFSQKIVTLISVIRRESLEKAFSSISESLYQDLRSRKPLGGRG